MPSRKKEIVPVKTMWKSFKPGMQSMHGDIKWEVGKWFTDTNKVKTCNGGFHASNNIVDAMRYVTCDVLALVEVSGKSDIENDKEAWESMRIVKAYQWDKEASVKVAIFAAELTLHFFEKKYPTDLRPRKAIEAAKAYLKVKGVKNKKAAAYAAYAAANAAADAAAAANAAAAYAAANAAAAYAAADAAHVAAYAAYAAADAAYAAYAADAAYARQSIKTQCQEYIINEILPTLKEYVAKD